MDLNLVSKSAMQYTVYVFCCFVIALKNTYLMVV